MRGKRFWIVLAVAALLLAALAMKMQSGSARPQAPATPAAAPATLEFLASDLATIGIGDLRQTLPLSGALQAVNRAVIKARVSGEIREVLVREGESVSAGQLLLRVDDTEYRARLAQAEGGLRAANGQLEIAAKSRDNNNALLGRGFISRNAFENAESEFAIARANVATAIGVLDVAKKAMADAQVRAPIAGLVSSRAAQVGEKVAVDARLMDIVDLRQLEMEAPIPAGDVLQVSPGQQVDVRVEGLADALPGKVVRINPATTEGSRSVITYIQIDNPRQALRVGMFGEAQLTVATRPGVVSVPQGALQGEDGHRFVYMVEAGKLVRRPVVAGAFGVNADGAAVEIVSGLASGAQVVRANLGNLPDGATVKIVAGK